MMMESENHYADFVKETGKDPDAYILRKIAADEWAYNHNEDAAILMMKPYKWWAGRFDDTEVIKLIRKVPPAWSYFIGCTPDMEILREYRE